MARLVPAIHEYLRANTWIARHKAGHDANKRAIPRELNLLYVSLKQRQALSQKSFWRAAGPMLDHAMILSIESGNQLS